MQESPRVLVGIAEGVAVKGVCTAELRFPHRNRVTLQWCHSQALVE